MIKVPIEEVVKKRVEERKRQYKAGKQLHGIYIRKHIHFLVAAILKVNQLTSREKIVVLADRRKANRNRPTIYACTHIGGNDVQRAFQVIKKPAYLMLGDPGMLYQLPIYYGLLLNGVIPLETQDREDRKIAYSRAVELLKKGGNLLIFPEGAWNITPDLLVMKTFTGTVRMAQETGAEIVPIAVRRYEHIFYFNIGESYFIPKYSEKTSEYLNLELRDKLATLTWEIIESVKPLCRNDIPKNYIHKFQSEVVDKCNFGDCFSLQDAIRERFYDKTITEPEEAFAHLNNLNPTMKNAFLLREYRSYTQLK